MIFVITRTILLMGFLLSKKARGFFKGIDLFGQPILSSFKGKMFYRTWSGGVLTTILVAAVIAFSLEAFISLILRENTKVAFTEIYETDRPKIEFTSGKGFYFAIDSLNENTR